MATTSMHCSPSSKGISNAHRDIPASSSFQTITGAASKPQTQPEKDDVIACDDVEEDSRPKFGRKTTHDNACSYALSSSTATPTPTLTTSEIDIIHNDIEDPANLKAEPEASDYENEDTRQKPTQQHPAEKEITETNNDLVVTIAAPDNVSYDTFNNDDDKTTTGVPKLESLILNLTSLLGEGLDDAVADTSFQLTLASQIDSTKSNDDDEINNNLDRKFLGIFSGSAILVNYISVGYVLLPWGFSQGGFILSTIVLIFVVFQSYITSLFILEPGACANLIDWRNALPTIAYNRTADNRRINVQPQQGSNNSLSVAPSRSPSVASNRSRLNIMSFPISIDSNDQPNLFRREQQQKVELSELCRVFLGTKSRNFFTITTAFDLYCITWTFAAAFAASMSNALPIMDGGGGGGDSYGTDISSASSSSLSSFTDYKLYILIFAAITIPLSCMTILDQLLLQMAFLGGRTFMLCLMIGTLIYAYIHHDVPIFGDQAGPAADVPLVDFTNIVTIFQVCIFSTAYQFAVPGIADHYESKISDPKKVLRIGVGYTFATNLILAILASFFFGRHNTAESNNLNWMDYQGQVVTEESRSGWSTFISSYIVLFVAIDGLAVFPLIALSLGDILLSAFYGAQSTKQSWKIQILFRLAGSVPQLVGAIFINDLSVMYVNGRCFVRML